MTMIIWKYLGISKVALAGWLCGERISVSSCLMPRSDVTASRS